MDRAEFRELLEEVLDHKLGAALSALQAELHHLRDAETPGPTTWQSSGHSPGTNEIIIDDALINLPVRDSKLDGEAEDVEQDNSSPQGGFLQQFTSNGSEFESCFDVARTFSILCGNKSNLNATDLVRMRARHSRSRLLSPDTKNLMPKYTEAIYAVNYSRLTAPRGCESTKTNFTTSFFEEHLHIITLDTFTTIMGRKEDLLDLEKEVLETVREIREILIKEETYQKIAQATNTSTTELQSPSFTKWTLGQLLLRYLDPFIGFVILTNAVVVIISTDVARGSDNWDYFEYVFTLIFFAELLIKILALGPKAFCTGHDMCWNLFDVIVVLFATLDLVLTRHHKDSASTMDLTVVRLLRFARLTKIVRVLKLKVFAELVMLVNGVLVGFRTLLWVVIFLIFLLLSLGLVMTEAVGRARGGASGRCEALDMHDREFCRDGEANLDKYRIALFGNVFRSMFTVFRCLTEGCNSMDGVPLVPQFLHSLGPGFIIVYMLVFVFVTFGLFNLVMAVFVESTINGAKRADIRRKEAQWGEHIKTARQLQQLMFMFLKGRSTSSLKNSTRHPLWTWLLESFSTRQTEPQIDEEVRAIKVTQQAFFKICDRPEAQKLLQELDIDFNSRRVIFDVLDANGNGSLELTELVQGLLRLRGAGDRPEMVAALLAIRAMQRSLKALNALSVHHQRSINRLLGQSENTQSIKPDDCWPRPDEQTHMAL